MCNEFVREDSRVDFNLDHVDGYGKRDHRCSVNMMTWVLLVCYALLTDGGNVGHHDSPEGVCEATGAGP